MNIMNKWGKTIKKMPSLNHFEAQIAALDAATDQYERFFRIVHALQGFPTLILKDELKLRQELMKEYENLSDVLNVCIEYGDEFYHLDHSRDINFVSRETGEWVHQIRI